MIGFYMPGRATRRKLAGSRCVMCTLGVTANDLCIGQFDDDQQVLHHQCVALLVEMMQKEANDKSADPEAGVDSAE